MEKKEKTLNPVPVIAALLVIGIFAAVLVRVAGLHGLTSLEGVIAAIRSAAPWSHLTFLLLQLGSVVLAPIPSNLMATAGGACFGFPMGFAITFFAVTFGSLLTFTLARLLGRKWTQRVVEKRISDKYLDLIQRKRDSFLVLVFLFPFFPDDIICILAGLTDIPFRRFALIVVLTRHWGLMVASLAGANLFVLPPWALPVIAGVGVVFFLAALRWGDRIEERLLQRFGK